MQDRWQHQIRAYLTPEAAEALRHGRPDPALLPLREVLRAHGAAAVSQLDAFETYLAEAEAAGSDAFPLYRWTRATLDDPTKRAKHAAAFALRIAGAETYDRPAADALERDLRPLVGAGAVARLSRHDTDPTNNLPIPAEYRQ